MDVRDDFGRTSPEGVPAPPPTADLSPQEATSPARRSPQVRAAQAIGSRRPDLFGRQSSIEV